MLKGYRFLIPAALVLMMVLGFYSVLSGSRKEERDYQAYLKEARRLAELDVIEDALTNYEEALKIRNTVDLNLEIGEMFIAKEWHNYALSWGENFITKFPKNAEAYTFLLKCYVEEKDYEHCFSLQDQASSRNAVNKEFREIMEEIQYVYEVDVDRFEDVGIFSANYAPVKNDGLWGYVNSKGRKVIREQFESAGAFNNDSIAAVKDSDGNWFYISESGNKKIALQKLAHCTELKVLSEGLICAAEDGAYQYYDEDFNVVIDGPFDDATAFNQGVAAVKNADGWILIDTNGRQISEEVFEDIRMDEKGIACRNDRIFAKSEDGIHMLDLSGKKVTEDTYDDAVPFFVGGDYAAVKKNGKWSFVDKEGNQPFEGTYDAARSFSNGYAAVEQSGRWGFITEDGSTAIEPTFVDAKDFIANGSVFVQTANNWQMLHLIRNNY